MFDLNYFNNKKQQLTQKANNNLQKFINSAFEMVSEAGDINERIKEIDTRITEETEKSKTKKDAK